ncbi:CsgG/HfaB family protein [Prosthecobacter sp.]|uniref:CsgG/HfaB family protein n=1 Tax=Prosthecobacter sp. TaxID=1965333 RepID=UPI003782E377
MKTPLLCLCLSVLLAANLQAQNTAPQPPLTVAVLPFEGPDERGQTKAGEVATLVAAQLSTNADLWMVERADIDKLLGEHNLKLSGLADPAAATQTGRILGARILVTGRIIPTGDNVLLVAKVMSVETSRVFGEKVSGLASASLEKPASELADKVGKLIAKQHAAFTPVFVTREERLARMKKAIEGKMLPSVQVSIPEQAIRQAVPDPAAETEMKNVLLALGFEVIDPKTPAKQPDIVITGEAFSESGVRRGQLISSRARIEVQALRHKDSKILAVERETGVAVDIAEAVAGKTALQEAGFTLVERIALKLATP